MPWKSWWVVLLLCSSLTAWAEGEEQAPAAPSEQARPAVLEGQVRARGYRRPIAGAVLESPGLGGPVQTDAEGRFRAELAPGEWEVLVQAPGFKPMRLTEQVASAQRLEVVYALEAVRHNPYETVVRGEDMRRELSRVTLTAQEMRELPGTLGDPFRAAMQLPGVHLPHTLAPFPVVRGMGPAATRFYVDGVEVPSFFHLGVLTSSVHPDFMESMSVYPSAPPVRYGRGLGGVMAATTRRPRDDQFHATLTLDLLNVSAFVETPTVPGGPHVAVAGRFGYTPTLAGSIASRSGATFEVGFWDAQLRVEQRVGEGRLRLLTLISSDLFDQGQVDSRFGAGFLFGRGDLRYRQPLGPGELELGLTYGGDRVAVREEALEPPVFADVVGTQASLSARALVTLPLAEGVRLTAGTEAWRLQGRFSQLSRTPQTGMQDQLAGGTVDGLLLTVYSELLLEDALLPGWSLNAGLRLDGYRQLSAVQHWALEPRVTLTRELGESVLLKAGFARLHQPPTPFLTLPAAGLADLRYGLQEVLQYELGADWRPLPWLEVGASAWYNNLARAVELDGYSDETWPFNSNSLFGRSLAAGGDPSVDRSTRGYAYGFDTFLRHKIGNGWFGWLSYGVSRSERLTRYYLRDERGQPVGVARRYLPYAFDQTHLVRAAVSWQPGNNWTLGLSGAFNTGRMDIQLEVWGEPSYTQRPSVDAEGNPTWVLEQRDRINRLPPYFQLNARVAKTWAFDNFLLEGYLDFYNASFSGEVVDHTYSVSRSESGEVVMVKEPSTLALVLPFLGVKATY